MTLDIKADNILVNWEQSQDEILVRRVQLGDLEDSLYLPPGKSVVGKQAGNWMWRSPEAHAGGPIKKSSDIFSFAIVVSLSRMYSELEVLLSLLTSYSVYVRCTVVYYFS